MTSIASVRTRQTRSQQSAARLLDAAEASLREADFGATSLNDIARRAGLTTGAVYSSFSNKAALFAALELRVCEQLESDAAKAFANAPEPLADFAAAVVRAIIRSYTAQRGGLRALALAARQDDKLAARVASVNRRILDHFCGALQRRLASTMSASAAADAEIGFLIACSALRETIVFETTWPIREKMSQQRLGTALAAVLAAHIEPAAGV